MLQNKMDGRTTQPHNSSMPLLSRLDHLDFIMTYLERKQNLANLGSNDSSATRVKRQCLPTDMAVKETYFKGSLLDRVAALERRLFQLCLKMESSSSSCTSTHTSADTYWSHGSKGQSSSSFPTFSTIPYHGPNKRLSQVHATRLEIEEQTDREHPKQKPPTTCPSQQQLRKKNRTNNKDEKSSKPIKKKPSSNWPYLKLLGCS